MAGERRDPRSALTGEPAAEQPGRGGFDEFYRTHYVAFVRTAALIAGSQADGEDLAQEAFALVAGRFGAIENPTAYLRMTIVNLVRSRYRDENRRQAKLHLLPAASTTVDSHETAELMEVIATLPVRQRVVIVGRYWAGWSEEELTRVLGCRPGTVKSLASRALVKLRSHIEEAER